MPGGVSLSPDGTRALAGESGLCAAGLAQLQTLLPSARLSPDQADLLRNRKESETIGLEMSEIMNFEEVVRDYWTHIFYFVLRCVRDREIAADLTQDCFLKACKGWEQFRGDCSVYTWLRRIALNTINTFATSNRIQFWRRASVYDVSTIEDVLPHPGRSPEMNVFMSERLETVRRAAQSLPSRQQLALALRFGEDMELQEIAKLMKVTEGAAKVRVFRALRSLRKTIRCAG